MKRIRDVIANHVTVVLRCVLQRGALRHGFDRVLKALYVFRIRIVEDRRQSLCKPRVDRSGQLVHVIATAAKRPNTTQ